MIAGIRFVDATTGGVVRQPLQLQATSSQFVQNQSGIYVLLSAPGFEEYIHTFKDSSNNSSSLSSVEPAAFNLTITVQDLSGQYLPRQFSLSLPRDANSAPNASTHEDSLFTPAEVVLYPSAIASTNPNWTVLKATVLNNANRRLPWALIRTTVNAETTLSQADWRGEALIAISGLPIVTASTDESADPSTREFSAELEVVFDPALNTLAENADFLTTVDPNPDYMPDLEQINASRGTLQTGQETLLLTSGQSRSMRLAVTLT